MAPADTIVAVATAPAMGGIGIVRLSGADARRIGEQLLGAPLRARHAQYGALRDDAGESIDSGIVIWFQAPHSFTGEDVVELQVHGAPVVLTMLQAQCEKLGARRARAGEFSERAFLNGRIDLTQAEAIADLIAAQSEAQARAAQRSLQGAFSDRVHALLAALIETRLHVEAAIDFPEEEIDFLADGAILERIQRLGVQVLDLLSGAQRGQRLRDGLHAVLIGAPNAGKSSLLNALAGEERAIVTDIAGTTRDLLRESLSIDGVHITLVDTAGLRESPDRIEAEGIRRARSELTRADLALLVLAPEDEPALASLQAEVPDGAALLVIHNKSDLLDRRTGMATERPFADPINPQHSAPTNAAAGMPATQHLHVSARTGHGLDALRQAIRQHAGIGESSDGSFSARARHVSALVAVRDAVERAESRLSHDRAGELVAEELRIAQQHLGEITGSYRPDDLLGAIFSSFCIGK